MPTEALDHPFRARFFDTIRSMQITVNGETQELPNDATSVADLLHSLAVGEQRIAVEVNEDIIPRGEHAQTMLKAGDRVEIVRAIGGG